MANKSQPAGILTIITGSIGILGSLALLAFIPLIHRTMTDPAFQPDTTLTPAEIQAAADLMTGVFSFMAVAGILLSIFIIVAGAYALKRRAWGLGLAGSIVGLFVFLPTAIPALVFMALSKPEFESRASRQTFPGEDQPNRLNPPGTPHGG
ncbi:hypothetical protein Dform_01271 [Dehalogenimonas formicexedens]|uniref:DUF4064 domain-containing protein n=1 Tax=Dehalogenimonas formicexedens TaxID=1839801 RepID=A0A1P8F7Z4_9CHLR|nr:DUF4064 domain-containing protein [Dehalogenimonas formicexedens]APV44599.1 hypothetical protein Dform_01271 [Dehalogenimonas formicexedens]